jgi:hypothetical protein
VSDTDSPIRERLDAAAAFDVEVDPPRVRENVARRQRRIRRRRPATVLLGALTAAGVALGVARMVDQDSGGDVAVRETDTTTAHSDDAGVLPGAPPYFDPAPGWEAVQVGPGATAANVPLGPATLSGNVPWDTVERLEDGDIVLFAMLYPAGEVSAVDAIFPRRELPLSLDDAQPGGLEGQPDDVSAERLLARVDGWNIDLLVFYGGGVPTAVPAVPSVSVASEPSAETRAAAQEQLARLVVPARE